MAAKKSRLPERQMALLTDEERLAIQERAAAKVREDEKKVAEKLYLEQCIRDEKVKANPDEEIVEVMIDVPGFADRITVDGVVFLHGSTYKVSVAKQRSLAEQMSNAWRHEEMTGGANRQEYHKPRNFVMNGTGTLLRA